MHAIAPNTNSSLSSAFSVRHSFPFDIVRSTPPTTDPFRGPFITTVQIRSLLPVGTFNYTEILPASFSIENRGNATVTTDNTTWRLTWTGLTNNSGISYTARPPLITPELYSLRGSVAYGNASFEEARPWYLAVDPACTQSDYNYTTNSHPVGEIQSINNKASDPFYLVADNDPGNTVENTATTGLYDGSTDASNDKLKIKYKGSGDGNFLRVDTGLQPGTASVQGDVLLKLVGSDVKIDQTCGNKQNFVDFETIIVYLYNSTTTINQSANVSFSVTSVRENTGCTTTTNACTVDAINLNLTSLWAQAPSTMNFTVRVVAIDTGNNAEVKEITEAYFQYAVNDPPNISTPVNASPTVSTGDLVQFNASCADPGDTFRLIVCRENATTCDTTTPGGNLLCQSSLSTSTTPACSYTARTGDIGNNTGSLATCCDSTGLCASTVTVNSWNVSQSPPSVTLNSPASSATDPDGNDTFNCSVPDDIDIVNVSLYENITGTWRLNQTTAYTGSGDTSVESVFNITNIANNTMNIAWNCLAVDNNTAESFAAANNTLHVVYSGLPQVTLNSPANGSTNNSKDVNVSCSATDGIDISSLSLFSNRSGTFQFEQTENYPGSDDTAVTKVFTLTNLADNTFIAWNCKAIDSDLNANFALHNFTFFVDLLQPNVSLVGPPDNSIVGTDLTLNCSATDDTDIANISLYHNIGGTWGLNQTVTFSGGSDTNVQANFSLSSIPGATNFKWGCFASDNEGLTAWAPSNYTAVTQPDGTVHFAQTYDTASTFKNPQNAINAPDSLFSDEKLRRRASSCTTSPPSTGRESSSASSSACDGLSTSNQRTTSCSSPTLTTTAQPGIILTAPPTTGRAP